MERLVIRVIYGVEKEMTPYPPMQGISKDDANMAGTYFDFADWDDDGAPVYKYAYQGDWTPVEDEEEVTACPAGQIRGTSGACIDDKTYAENPWEEPKKTPQALVDKRTDWDANWDPNRSGITSEQQGSIPFTRLAC